MTAPAHDPPAPATGERPRVLVVDDDQQVGQSTVRVLLSRGIHAELDVDPRQTLRRFESGEGTWDVVLLDVSMPNVSGLELLVAHQKANLPSSVVMLTADQSASTAADCMRAGAFNFLTKPTDPDSLADMVHVATRYARLRRSIAPIKSPQLVEAVGHLMVGESPAICRLRESVTRLSQTAVSVLVQAESGTGKELVARALHMLGARRQGPFVAINCSTVPESLIDSELFGHEKGAFTGATTARAGVFLEANGGTLFLDEIGDMPLAVQAKLLRVLQEREVRPLGASRARPVDVRVVAATHVDLTEAVEHKRFRRDLYYRLNVVSLTIPPLRARREDLQLLATHFLRKHASDPSTTLSAELLDAFLVYTWPGNIRELENVILGGLALATGNVIELDDVPSEIRATRGSAPNPGAAEDEGGMENLAEAKRRHLEDFERTYLLAVIQKSRGSVSEAARIAGVDRSNFRRLLQRHGLSMGKEGRPDASSAAAAPPAPAASSAPRRTSPAPEVPPPSPAALAATAAKPPPEPGSQDPLTWSRVTTEGQDWLDLAKGPGQPASEFEGLELPARNKPQ